MFLTDEDGGGGGMGMRAERGGSHKRKRGKGGRGVLKKYETRYLYPANLREWELLSLTVILELFEVRTVSV